MLLFCNICLLVPIHATESIGTEKGCKNDASKILKRKLPMFLDQRKGLILPETTLFNELHKILFEITNNKLKKVPVCFIN